MASNPPDGTPQISPRLAYTEPAAAVEWLGVAFGLRERDGARVEGEDGRLILTELELGAGLVMIGRSGSHGLASPAELEGRTQMVVAYVEDVAGHYERAKAGGATVVMPLEDQPWGDRRYEALDLEGHRWCFLEHLRDVPPEEWKRAVFRGGTAS